MKLRRHCFHEILKLQGHIVWVRVCVCMCGGVHACVCTLVQLSLWGPVSVSHFTHWKEGHVCKILISLQGWGLTLSLRIKVMVSISIRNLVEMVRVRVQVSIETRVCVSVYAKTCMLVCIRFSQTLGPVSILNQFIPNGPLVFSKGNRFQGNQQVIHHTCKWEETE